MDLKTAQFLGWLLIMADFVRTAAQMCIALALFSIAWDMSKSKRRR